MKKANKSPWAKLFIKGVVPVKVDPSDVKARLKNIPLCGNIDIRMPDDMGIFPKNCYIETMQPRLHEILPDENVYEQEFNHANFFKLLENSTLDEKLMWVGWLGFSSSNQNPSQLKN